MRTVKCEKRDLLDGFRLSIEVATALAGLEAGRLSVRLGSL